MATVSRIQIDSVVAIFIILCIGAYYLGHHNGFASAYTIGEHQGANLQLASDKKSYATLQINNSNLINQYNTLSGNYNNLRSAVIKYVGATQYKISAPITCNSFGSSISITTTCF